MPNAKKNLLFLSDDLLIEINDGWLSGAEKGWISSCVRLRRLLFGRFIVIDGKFEEPISISRTSDGIPKVHGLTWMTYRGSFRPIHQPWLAGLRALVINGKLCDDPSGLVAVLQRTTGLQRFEWVVDAEYTHAESSSRCPDLS